MRFKVGDRGVCTNDTGWEGSLKKGSIYTIDKIIPNYMDGLDGLVIDCERGKGIAWKADEKFIKLIGGSMSKYEELKDRIEDNKRRELGWGKEFDDILEEINPPFVVVMPTKRRGAIVIFKERLVSLNENEKGKILKKEIIERFTFSSQREKNNALHNATLWLLENSDIKKEDKNKEIKKEIENLQIQVDNLKKKLG